VQRVRPRKIKTKPANNPLEEEEEEALAAAAVGEYRDLEDSRGGKDGANGDEAAGSGGLRRPVSSPTSCRASASTTWCSAVETVTELELGLLWVRKLTSHLFGHVVGDVRTYPTQVPTRLIAP
jgi:hypothetical protein